MSLDLETAREIVRATREAAAIRRLHPIVVVVLDSGGHMVVAEREDGASINQYDAAFGKAAVALARGRASRALMTRAGQQPFFIAAVAAAIGGSLIPLRGGVLVRDSAGVAVGAVGVSGDLPDDEEAVAITGAEFVGLTADPG